MTIRLQPITPHLPGGFSGNAPPNALRDDRLTPFLKEVIASHNDLYPRNGTR